MRAIAFSSEAFFGLDPRMMPVRGKKKRSKQNQKVRF
jgi:hypothetical protein